MEAIEFNAYTERLRSALESRPEVLGLVTLGSTADSKLRDEWSDHDFWVITKSGAQDSLIADLSWLPDVDDLVLKVNHGPGRRTFVYPNRHKVEFAIFDANQARSEGKAERYQILIDRDQVAELMKEVQQVTIGQARLNQAKPDGLDNLCVLVWSACERYIRGESISARQYIDGFAVNQLLNLIHSSGTEPVDRTRDELDPRRRLEVRSPELAAELLVMMKEPVPKMALRLLNVAERELKQKAPTLSWESVTMVREWVTELIQSDGNATS